MTVSPRLPGPGDRAPDVDLPRVGGGRVALASLAGKTVVLYFYPRDDTPGCTTEAIDFTRLGSEFDAAGAVVIGISKDSVAAHERFCRKHGLGVILASDAGADTCERYGTWVEKSLYGKTSMGIERATFLIDGTGRIAEVWRKVRVPGHAEAVLAAVRAAGRTAGAANGSATDFP